MRVIQEITFGKWGLVQLCYCSAIAEVTFVTPTLLPLKCIRICSHRLPWRNPVSSTQFLSTFPHIEHTEAARVSHELRGSSPPANRGLLNTPIPKWVTEL